MNKRSNPVMNFLRGKGFYVVLAGCIITAAGCSFVAIRNMMNELNENASSTAETGESQWITQPTLPDLPKAPVENKASSVPVSSKPVESAAPSSAPQSSSALPQSESITSSEPEKPAEVSAPSFVQPVSGQMLHAFSGDELVFNKTLGDWRTHNGTDFAAAVGEEVKNAKAGTVIKAAEDGSWGGVVEVDCGDVTLRYAGLSIPIKVKEGDAVSVGQVLGKVSEVPCESGVESHIHIEAMKDGVYADPAQWLK